MSAATQPDSSSDSGGDEICELSDMERRGCDHCRERGLYTPSPVHPVNGRTFRLDDSMAIGMDGAGELWIGPDETFRRMGRD